MGHADTEADQVPDDPAPEMARGHEVDLMARHKDSVDEPEGSKTQGIVLLTLAAAGVGVAVFHSSYADFGALFIWIVGWAAVIWAAKRPNKMQTASNPAPPPPSEGVVEEEPQVNTVKDPKHPNRWIVLPDKRTGTDS